jgi:hypothetical protein
MCAIVFFCGARLAGDTHCRGRFNDDTLNNFAPFVRTRRGHYLNPASCSTGQKFTLLGRYRCEDRQGLILHFRQPVNQLGGPEGGKGLPILRGNVSGRFKQFGPVADKGRDRVITNSEFLGNPSDWHTGKMQGGNLLGGVLWDIHPGKACVRSHGLGEWRGRLRVRLGRLHLGNLSRSSCGGLWH